MRVLSLFSGGGLGDYGLTLAGMEIVGQVEIDDYCQRVLSLRWPDVPKWGDIREVKGQEVIERCGRVDVVSGGFPCQDISAAGRGAGIAGERSGLWKEMLRIVREVRPRYVLVENVAALLGRGLGTVLGDLAACGYDAQWDCIPACAVGAPHRRDRVWIVAYSVRERGREDESTQNGWESDSNGRCKNVADSRSGRRRKSAGASDSERKSFCASFGQEGASIAGSGGEALADAKGKLRKRSRDSRARRNGPSNSGQICDPESYPRRVFDRKCKEDGAFWATEPNVGRVAHGTPNRVDRLKLLGNGQVVQVVQWIGERIMEFDAHTTHGKERG